MNFASLILILSGACVLTKVDANSAFKDLEAQSNIGKPTGVRLAYDFITILAVA